MRFDLSILLLLENAQPCVTRDMHQPASPLLELRLKHSFTALVYIGRVITGEAYVIMPLVGPYTLFAFPL